jgi:hypothetical protein
VGSIRPKPHEHHQEINGAAIDGGRINPSAKQGLQSLEQEHIKLVIVVGMHLWVRRGLYYVLSQRVNRFVFVVMPPHYCCRHRTFKNRDPDQRYDHHGGHGRIPFVGLL